MLANKVYRYFTCNADAAEVEVTPMPGPRRLLELREIRLLREKLSMMHTKKKHRARGER